MSKLSATTSGPVSVAPSPPRTVATPSAGRWQAEAFVKEHLGHLIDRRGVDLPDSSSVYRGGQTAADTALASFDVEGYAAGWSHAYPMPRRRVSGLSPYVRHGFLSLQQLWDHVADGPDADVRAFRGELLWQEYARHRHARRRVHPGRSGSGDAAATETAAGERAPDPTAQRSTTGRGWNRSMGCVELALDELEEDGWLPGQARRWLANHWSVAKGEDPAEGEEHFFRHLLDGSRAANRLGWAGAASFPFTRWDVEERAAGLCASCELVGSCPIERQPDADVDLRTVEFPDTPADPDAESATGGTVDPDADAGPRTPWSAADGAAPDSVWLTAESLGDADPALAAHPDLPVVFVFDERLLARLRLSSKRLVFLAESLSDLALRREVELHIGDPVEILGDRRPAVTFTPVPGWRSRVDRIDPALIHPWPWLRQPHDGDLTSFDQWRRGIA